MADASALVVQAAVGLLSGGTGAIVGARAQRRLDDRRYGREKRAALWQLVRALKQTGEMLTHERHRVETHADLAAAKEAAGPFLHTLPYDLQKTLETEPPERETTFEHGEDLWDLGLTLEKHLNATTPKGERPA